ncbi:MAG TPA: acetate/propionate family kinase [Casimicrobiaceae bacterium]|jgi:acetate kinase|nr:acetate/propionate family kinase [Casimicrobiaceae bacterium]
MRDAILVLNAGSSSLKFSVFVSGANLTPLVAGNLEELQGRARFRANDATGAAVDEHAWPDGEPPGHEGAIAFLLDWLRANAGDGRLAAVGHRVVHGGADYAAPVRVTPAVLARLERLAPLAPLHQPHNLLPIRTLAARVPDLAQVACFDTGFHSVQSAVARAFALPRELSDAGVRRYGFHGLSYEYIASVLPQYDARAAAGRTIVLHLGNGASMCAMHAGRSVATTMGFTAVDGLPMGTRTGSLDPGVLLYLMDEHGMDARAIETLIYKRSGLLGVSGISSDMRELLESNQPHARDAIELFCYRIGRELGSLAAALRGLDAIVFTAGIGERAVPIRDRVCRDASWLGLALDPVANARNGPRISRPDSQVAAWVIATDEEHMIARHTRAMLQCA